MRIGTWNVEGRRGAEQTAFLLAQDCDVWLLTEVSHRLNLPGYHLTQASAPMASSKRWAVVASRGPLDERPSPHPASAAAIIDGTTYVSSVLPWRSSGTERPWNGNNHADRMAAALEALAPFLRAQSDLVWGGDWNQSLDGPEYVGTKAGRQQIIRLIDDLELAVPTADQPHRAAGLLSIDHIACVTMSETLAASWRRSTADDSATTTCTSWSAKGASGTPPRAWMEREPSVRPPQSVDAGSCPIFGHRRQPEVTSPVRKRRNHASPA